MGVFERVRSALGFGTEAEAVDDSELSGRLIPVPPVEVLLPVTDRLRSSWNDEARDLASDVVDLSTSEFRYEYPAIAQAAGVGTSGVLPGDRDERMDVIGNAFVSHLQAGYDAHLKEVGVLLTSDDAEVRETLSLREDAPIPGIDDPRSRADYISSFILEWGALETDRGDRLDVVSLQRNGMSLDAGEARTGPIHDYAIVDPSLSEIARRVVDLTSSRDPAVLRDDLSGGPIPLGERHLDMAVHAAVELGSDPAARDAVIGNAFREHYAVRHPSSSLAWKAEAAEVLAEDQRFLERRYGNLPDKSLLSVDDVIGLELEAKSRMMRADADRQKGVSTEIPLSIDRVEVVGVKPVAAQKARTLAFEAGRDQGMI